MLARREALVCGEMPATPRTTVAPRRRPTPQSGEAAMETEARERPLTLRRLARPLQLKTEVR